MAASVHRRCFSEFLNYELGKYVVFLVKAFFFSIGETNCLFWDSQELKFLQSAA
jgi:hypothetical protein